MMLQQQQQQNVDTSRVDEILAKEPVFNAQPKKSALKKKPVVGGGSGGPGGSSGGGGGSSSSGPGTPTSGQPDTLNRPLIVRQDNDRTATIK